ncbi:lipoate-protein ligase A [Candidatus Kinetoplastibacterium blastocrithidii TCC012E]|uniref:Lipoate-protein ligase A n=1 Tax=Candidatus Kinetoplastidibacterium blastocrithidiae TCC012E TaxID=1208922 RepID=M1M3U0_9PROT|nr:biotin/lipoate A/B protein ligase family protein [Candidatus Kinetoplastibacterium blastocrithidii]AFZ83653.1 lipoate-protein ligase A [Candidatus Kinetoplastibacterium blastocrithidii (ex Strigomonas culicis)]AGF49774.1 lipoate-protein ligase A [Candidatus Kinetoplastibacterium blastocrithidii TCC012E]
MNIVKKLEDCEWQLIHTSPQSPNLHMALDSIITEEVNKGIRLPTLRIWEWDSSAVVLGRFQSFRNEINEEAAKIHNVKIVRRVSGGGAMFVEPENSITYSISIPNYLVSNLNFQESYQLLDNWIIETLNSIGIEAFYKPINDILLPSGQKIGGAAQARFSDAILHHVTMSYKMDTSKMVEILRIGKEKISDKGITSAKKRVAENGISQSGMSRTNFIKHMINIFSRKYKIIDTVDISEDTIFNANKLCKEKFDTYDWLHIVK